MKSVDFTIGVGSDFQFETTFLVTRSPQTPMKVELIRHFDRTRSWHRRNVPCIVPNLDLAKLFKSLNSQAQIEFISHKNNRRRRYHSEKVALTVWTKLRTRMAMRQKIKKQKLQLGHCGMLLIVGGQENKIERNA